MKLGVNLELQPSEIDKIGTGQLYSSANVVWKRLWAIELCITPCVDRFTDTAFSHHVLECLDCNCLNVSWIRRAGQSFSCISSPWYIQRHTMWSWTDGVCLKHYFRGHSDKWVTFTLAGIHGAANTTCHEKDLFVEFYTMRLRLKKGKKGQQLTIQNFSRLTCFLYSIISCLFHWNLRSGLLVPSSPSVSQISLSASRYIRTHVDYKHRISNCMIVIQN